jgi:hypothetical protein
VTARSLVLATGAFQKLRPHFLRKRKSGLLCGVGEDAAVLAELITDRPGSA